MKSALLAAKICFLQCLLWTVRAGLFTDGASKLVARHPAIKPKVMIISMSVRRFQGDG